MFFHILLGQTHSSGTGPAPQLLSHNLRSSGVCWRSPLPPRSMQNTRTLPWTCWSCGRVCDYSSIGHLDTKQLLELVIHLVCFFMNSSVFSDPRALMSSRIAGTGVNLSQHPIHGIVGIFLSQMLLHFHQQLVNLHTCSLKVLLNSPFFFVLSLCCCCLTRIQLN